MSLGTSYYIILIRNNDSIEACHGVVQAAAVTSVTSVFFGGRDPIKMAIDDESPVHTPFQITSCLAQRFATRLKPQNADWIEVEFNPLPLTTAMVDGIYARNKESRF